MKFFLIKGSEKNNYVSNEGILMRYSKLLSIVIPTRNRQKYALKSVKQILQFNDNDIQVVIQDNSDDRSLENQLLQLADSRIKYNYCENILSFVDNFSTAIELADGEYCCIIGDDDGITSPIIDVVRWAKRHNVDAIKPEILFEYFWPNSINLKGHTDNGLIRLLDAPIKAQRIDTNQEILTLLKNGGQHYGTLNMVKLYHGIVRKSCIEAIKSTTGKYFGGLSPDIYIAVALSLTSKTVLQINFPLTIAGVCGNSGSADSSKGRHVGRLEEAPHLRGHSYYEWSELVPKFYSVETIWADSALAAIKDIKRDDLIGKFRISSLSSTCLRKHKEYKEITKDHYKDILQSGTLKQKFQFQSQSLIYPIKEFSGRVIRRISRLKRELIFIENIKDIISANEEFEKYMNEKKISVDYIIDALDAALN